MKLLRRLAIFFLLISIATIHQASADPFYPLRSACFRAIESVRETVRTTPVRVNAGLAQTRLSPKAYAIFERAYRDPELTITPEERQLLMREEVYDLFQAYLEASPALRWWNHAKALNIRSRTPDVRNALRKLLGTLIPLRIQIPLFPKLFNTTQHQINDLWERTLEHPEQALDANNPWELIDNPWDRFLQGATYLPTLFRKDDALLRREKLLDTWKKFQEDAKTFQREFGGKRRLKNAMEGIKTSLRMGVLTLAMLFATTTDKTITASEAVDLTSANSMRIGDRKVELIFMHPLPHVSVRLGGVIYTFRDDGIARIGLKDFAEEIGFGPRLSGTMVRVELNLDNKAKAELRARLEQMVYTSFDYDLLYENCISKTLATITPTCKISVPPGLNRSQALTLAYLKAQRLLGNAVIGDITVALNDSAPNEEGALIDPLTQAELERVGSAAVDAGLFLARPFGFTSDVLTDMGLIGEPDQKPSDEPLQIP